MPSIRGSGDAAVDAGSRGNSPILAEIANAYQMYSIPAWTPVVEQLAVVVYERNARALVAVGRSLVEIFAGQHEGIQEQHLITDYAATSSAECRPRCRQLASARNAACRR